MSSSATPGTLNVTLRIWRQKDRHSKGRFIDYPLPGISPDQSFLEMLDVLNNRLEAKGEDPVAFDSDCREGICGTCSLHIEGIPHGPQKQTTTCQLHMRRFHDGQTITIEPFRARAFPVLKDLIVDRSSFDRIIQSGGFISVKTGSAPDANSLPVPKVKSDIAMDAAQCIGCGACVAACKNASASLFVAAKVSHLGSLPQGTVEKKERVRHMIAQMDKEGFGSCTNLSACEAACPKGIHVGFIAQMNRDYLASV